MSPEEVKAAGAEGSKRPPGNNHGAVHHQRRNLPFSRTTMAIGGILITAAIGYMVYSKKNAEARDRDRA
ncbi:hypothetical protein HS088_TW09G01436 [Tripterygium wilfordii]|uniref:Transmembrane protein n=1 Tax=Tripterygium wilfordii TaxID=458696 RepID=A0A7J7DAT5_TRIWF|nr:hypothetical protein HS088_TW09G01436 [Tripterygium wilfordii]